MREFEITTVEGFLGKRVLAAGNTEKFIARLAEYLDRGIIVTAATATVTSLVSTVSTPALSEGRRSVTFYVTSPTADDTFTLKLVVTTSDGQTLNYTIAFVVSAPRSAS